MKDVMVDLETMGKKVNSKLLSIGACEFDITTGDIGRKFHMQINLDKCFGEYDASTIIWWMKQSDEARSKFYDNGKGKDIKQVLSEFSAWYPTKATIWGNGATFDIGKLQYQYDRISVEAPWEYYNENDVRTIVRLGKVKGFDPKRDMPFVGVKHDALCDAIHQAKYVSAIYKRIIG